MKRTISLCTAALLGLGLATQATAGPGHERGHHPGFERGPGRHFQSPPRHHHHYAPPPRQHHNHHRHERRDWIGPAAVLTIGGLALGSALYYNQQREPVVVYQSSPPDGNWFYCRSSGQYYPNTQACPEGWVTVTRR